MSYRFIARLAAILTQIPKIRRSVERGFLLMTRKGITRQNNRFTTEDQKWCPSLDLFFGAIGPELSTFFIFYVVLISSNFFV